MASVLGTVERGGIGQGNGEHTSGRPRISLALPGRKTVIRDECGVGVADDEFLAGHTVRVAGFA
jgi:hypothetical protein